MRNTRKIFVALLLVLTMMVSVFAVTANAAAGQVWTVAGSKALCGSDWSTTDTKNDMTYDAATDSYVKIYTNVKAGNYEFKCAKNHAWTTSYPGSNYKLKVDKDGSTVTITLKGTTVTAKVEAPSCNHKYEITAGTVTCTTAGNRTWTCSVCGDSYTENLTALGHRYGEDGKCKACDVTATVVKVYLDNADNWANVYCYAWATDPYVAWPGEAMEKGDDGLYYYVVPTSCVNVIFNNGEGTQSADLKTPTDNAVVYNNAAKVWAEKNEEVEIPEVTYIVAGNTELTGFNWDPNQTANAMTLGEDGLYTKVYENVMAGKHVFKVVQDGNWDLCWGDPANTSDGQNFAVTVAGGSKITITFDPATKNVSCSVEAPAVSLDTYTVSGTICPDGQWNLDDDLMTLGEDGIYSITYTDVKKGGYSFKVFKNRSWDNGFSDGNDNYDCYIKYDGSVVTIKFDPATSTITHEVYYNNEQVILYIVAGDPNLLGSNWAHTDVNNEMTKLEDGKYQLVIEGAKAGSYKLKVVKDGNWDVKACGAADGSDYVLAVAEDGSKVTITYDVVAHAISHTVEAPVCEHEYMFPCDAHCAKCGELTNPDAKHAVSHIEAVAATCQASGNLEFWMCSDCGGMWLDENLVQNTNRMNVMTFGDHTYAEGKCTVCGEADPNYVPPVVETKPIVNVSDLAAGTTTGDELIAGTGIYASAGLSIDANGKEIDGFTFTLRLKLGGTMTADAKHVKIVVDGPSNIVVYAIASSKDATGRTLRLATLADGTFTTVVESGEVNGTSIAKYEFAAPAAGTYYLGSTDSGINLYYIAVETETEAPACEHEYMFPCDAHCAKCGELTNPDAKHTIVHTEAVAAKCEVAGNVEYWACSDCGSAWLDEALTMVTNRMSIVLPALEHFYVYNFCYNCYAPNPYFIANNIVPGANKVICNEYHLVANGEGEHGFPYEFPFLTITEAGTYVFTTDKVLSIFVYTTPVTEDNADAFVTGGTGWLVFDEDGTVDLEPGVYYIGFIYISGEGEYNVNVEKKEPVHEHNFVDGKCECGETDPNYVAPEQPKDDPETPDTPETPEQPDAELSFFDKIMKAITDFFAQIVAWFQGLFAGNKN